MTLFLRASMVEFSADADASKRWISGWLEVVNPGANLPAGPPLARCCAKYRYMCQAVQSLCHSASDSGERALGEIRSLELDERSSIQTGANDWIIHLSRTKVWFEGLYDQGEGGEVTFAQYKFAVENYVRFLADPGRKPLEVPFPED